MNRGGKIMKKTYSTPVAEKIEFRYREQVVASQVSLICTQEWFNLDSKEVAGCSHQIVVSDSGF